MYLENLELISYYSFQGTAFWRLDEELARQLHADLNWEGHFEVGQKIQFSISYSCANRNLLEQSVLWPVL
jgi:hypothetical protein